MCFLVNVWFLVGCGGLFSILLLGERGCIYSMVEVFLGSIIGYLYVIDFKIKIMNFIIFVRFFFVLVIILVLGVKKVIKFL